MVSTQLSGSVEASLMELQCMEDDERPDSLFRCMQEDGVINMHMYSEHTQKEDELDSAQDALWKACAEDRLSTRKKTIRK
jgi:trehalose-6-phosphatase